MDHTSNQPMLSGPTPGHVLEVESGKEGRKPMFIKTQSKLVICCLIFFIILSIVLLLALLVAIFALGAMDICTTPQCLQSASSLITSMDTTADPCEDFNKFVCGKWSSQHLMHDSLNKYSWFSETKLKLEHTITQFLEQENSPDDPEAVVKARRLYRSCNDLESMSENGAVALNMALVKSVGLQLFPPVGPSPPKQSWIRSVALAKKTFDLNIILGFSLAQRPENRSEIRIVATYPQKEGLYELLQKKGRKKLSENERITIQLSRDPLLKFMEYIISIVEHSMPDVDKKLNKAADDILKVMTGLAEIAENEEVMRANQVLEFKEFKLKDLQDLIDSKSKGGKSKIKLKQFFNTIFEGIPGVKLDFDGRDTVLASNLPYLEELTKFLDDVSEHQLDLYIWFQILYNLSPHVNINMSILKRHMEEAGKETGISEPRQQFCQRATTVLMESAVSYFIFQDPHIEEKRAKVQEMLTDLKGSFVSHLNGITWMDKETKDKAVEKAAAMETYVAFLDKYKNKTVLDEEYKNVTIKENTYFDNVKRILEHVMYESLTELRNPFKLDMLQFEMSDINAFYNPTGNNIFVPGGILQFPFYDLGLEALNYGSIGVILGHELTHGFDEIGRKYDKEGNKYDWWTSEADEEYSKRTQCYINVYSDYDLPGSDKKIDGELTLEENIADDGGLVEAFHAYKKYLEENGEESRLPGLEKYDNEQLFFLSFAHTWCVAHRDSETLEADLVDVHSPEAARATLALRNFKEFARVWNCPAGSKMNPNQEVCKIWMD